MRHIKGNMHTLMLYIEMIYGSYVIPASFTTFLVSGSISVSEVYNNTSIYNYWFWQLVYKKNNVFFFCKHELKPTRGELMVVNLTAT